MPRPRWWGKPPPTFPSLPPKTLQPLRPMPMLMRWQHPPRPPGSRRRSSPLRWRSVRCYCVKSKIEPNRPDPTRIETSTQTPSAHARTLVLCGCIWPCRMIPRIVEGHKTGIDVEVRVYIPFYYVCVPPWNEEVPYMQYSYLFVKSFLHNQMQNFLI